LGKCTKNHPKNFKNPSNKILTKFPTRSKRKLQKFHSNALPDDEWTSWRWLPWLLSN
jgi:hypothetical protein